MQDTIPYYRHYSFDLWLTLIRSDPQFKTARARIFHRDYNQAGKGLTEVAAAFRTVDLMCNAINERTGKNIDQDELHLMVISLINGPALNMDDIDTDKLCRNMEALLYEHPPVWYEPGTADVLHRLKEATGSTLSILSNTGFIKGATLRTLLDGMGMQGYFSFQLYSDEAGLSKPNIALYKLMQQSVQLLYPGEHIPPAAIMHTGDNPRADVAGAAAAGMSTMLINANDKTIHNLLSICAPLTPCTI